MKFTFTLFIFLSTQLSFSEEPVVSASDVCLTSAKIWAIKSEAKKTSAKIVEIKDIESKVLGNGANLFLSSIFVTGPKTGDNTHWEVVGEFNYNTKTCKIIVGRRYWTH